MMLPVLFLSLIDLAALSPGYHALPEHPPWSARTVQDILTEDTYEIEVHITIIDEETLPIWSEKLSRKTSSGKPIQLQIKKGDDFMMKTILLPYAQDEKSIVMVIRGGAWLSYDRGKKTRYRSIFHSVPLQFSVPISIRPLGDMEEGWQKFFHRFRDNAPSHNIEITIKVTHD